MRRCPSPSLPSSLFTLSITLYSGLREEVKDRARHHNLVEPQSECATGMGDEEREELCIGCETV